MKLDALKLSHASTLLEQKEICKKLEQQIQDHKQHIESDLVQV
jgi:hypothetical protein